MRTDEMTEELAPATAPVSESSKGVSTAGQPVSRSRWLRAAALALIGLVAAWSWLFIVSKWGPASRIDILTFKAGLTSQIMRSLMKEAHGAGPHDHMAAMISGIYATPTYYSMTEQTEDSAKYLPDKYAVFYIFEDVHMGELPKTPPAARLRMDDGREVAPLDTEVLRDSFHHRATVVRFSREDAQGKPLFTDKTKSFELVTDDNSMPGMRMDQTMQWTLPIVYPKDVQEKTALSLPTLFGLLAGLLAVLSPCLLQLTVYYTFALAGVSMGQNGADLPDARARVVRTALFFIAGFTIVFTATGSLAGLAGQKLQTTGIMESLNRPLSIAAGIGVLLLGIWVGANAGAPGLCQLPGFAKPRGQSKWMDSLRMMFMGSAFAIGCSTCFGGALFISLMIYVGAVGSAALGAFALFLFSLGIAIPYLLAAFFLSRALPLLGSLQRAASGIGLVCSVVLTFFGVILITDNFHVPSNWLYRLYLGL
jgi:cytochrome c biogenesis protein CcdA